MRDKQVLLTGGTGGLGLGVTPAVLARAEKITIPYHSDKGINRLKNQLSAEDFERLRFVKADLTQEAEVEKLVNDIGRVDVLIHLVGGFSMGAVEEFSYTDWQSLLALNLNTTFLVCKYCLKLMRKQGYGRIVTVGSITANNPAPQLAAYCASKSAVATLTQAIAAETAGSDITANAVLPSTIDTPNNREAMGTDQVDEWVKPESIAKGICFLAFDAPKDLRGALLPF